MEPESAVSATSNEVAPRGRLHRMAGSPLWFGAVLPFALIRALLTLVGFVTIYYVMPLINQPVPTGTPWMNDPLQMLWRMFDRFDTGWYLSISQGGYWSGSTITVGAQSNWAFFPLYPLLIRIGASPIGNDYNSLFLVGLAISTVSAFACAIYLFKLTAMELDEVVARKAVLYLGLFPLSFYLWSDYPESMFLAFLVAGVFYARRRRWLVAGILGGLAALTRPQGILLFPILGWEYWQYISDKWSPIARAGPGLRERASSWLRSRVIGPVRSMRSGRTWTGFASLLPIPLAFGGFLVYAQVTIGDYMAFSHAETLGWQRSLSNPVGVLAHAILHPSPPSPFDWNFWALNMLALVCFGIMFIVVLRKLPSTYKLLAFLFMLLPLASGMLNSLARYYLAVFPVFIALAWWTSQGSLQTQMRRHEFVAISFAMGLALTTGMFVLGIYAMA